MRNRMRRLLLVLIAVASAASAEQPAWVSAGPDDVGTIYDLKAADGVVYAATSGGVYRSTPSGDGWEFSGLRKDLVRSIAVEANSAVYALIGYGDLAVSRNGGGSWDRLTSGASLSAVVVDPQSPATAYLADYSGIIWKTTDSGAAWKRLPSADLRYVWALEIDPYDGALAILGSSIFSGLSQLRRTTNDGGSYTTVTIAGQADPLWYYMAAGGPGTGRFYASLPNQVCRTSDGAATWTCSAVEGYARTIVEVPGTSASAAPTILLATDHGLLVSRDGGNVWSRADDDPLATSVLQAVAYDPSSAAAYVGTDSGIYRSADGGGIWSWHGQGLRSAMVTALAVDPTDPAKIIAGTGGFATDEGPGLFRSADQGETWTSLSSTVAPSPFGSLTFASGSSSILYGTANGNFYRSEDAGGSWSEFHSNNHYFSRLATDPRAPGRIYAGDQRGLARSDDGGRTWATSGVSQSVYSLVFDGHDPSTLYAGSYFDLSYGYYAYPQGGSIFVSRDLGATWTHLPGDLGAAPVALAADPFAGGVVYAGTSRAGVLRSSDGGRTWAGPSGDFPQTIADVVADPSRPGHLYAAADGTVYRSRDGGKTWQPFDDGFDGPPVVDLAIAGGGRRLVAATSGSGIYQIDLGVAPSFPCVADAEHLCLVGGRYALEVAVHGRGQWSPGAAHALTDRAGYFGFPAVTGDAGFPEVAVKMLPAGALGPGGAAIFHAGLTSLPYVLTLTDTVTGEQHFYAGNQGGSQCGGVDQPFPDAPALARPEATEAAPNGALSLLDHRFSVTIHARHPRTGRESDGLAVAGDDRWGYFSMPDITGDPALPEVLVKMVDFSRINGKFWVFYTGLTGFDYTLTVTDTTSGAVRTYESTNAFCGEADTSAFAD